MLPHEYQQVNQPHVNPMTYSSLQGNQIPSMQSSNFQQINPTSYVYPSVPPMMNSIYGNPITSYPQQQVFMQPTSNYVMPTAHTVFDLAQPMSSKPTCPHGANCSMTNNDQHKDTFMHPCKYGSSCKNQSNPVHVSRFTHGSVGSTVSSAVKSTSKTPKTSTTSSSTSTSDGFALPVKLCPHQKCTNSDPNHKSTHMHTCKYGSECRIKTEYHATHYVHPCKDGSGCALFLKGDPKHITMFSHKISSQNQPSVIKKYEWPTEWNNPNPPPLSKNPFSNPHFAIVPLSTSSQEYQSTSALFKQSCLSSTTIQDISRVENYALWHWFCYQKKKMQGGGNERRLFHGTNVDIVGTIAKTGLDVRVGRFGKFGMGIYFSPEASYSQGYASGSGPKKLFVCRVLVGETHSTTSMLSNIKMPPLKPNQIDRFDSVTGIGGKEVIVYDNNQAYPEYIVTYQ